MSSTLIIVLSAVILWGGISLIGYWVERNQRFRNRYELEDVQDVLNAALDSNPQDAKKKIEYVLSELRRLT